MDPIVLPKKTNVDMQHVVLSCLEAIDTPVSLSVYLRVLHEVQELPDVHPSGYLDGYAYQKDAQALALVSKSSFFIGPSKKELISRAFLDFSNAEKRCLNTNSRVRSRLYFDELDLLLRKVAGHVREVLRDDLPTDTWLPGGLLFGPGATSSCSAPETTLLHKIVGNPEVTSGCIDLLHTITGEQYDFSDYTIVESNRFTTVPKSWKQLRGICIEPHLNTHFQRCLGVAMVHRLMQAGVKLAEVPLENCFKLSNSPELYATIDLKQASDSISREVIMATFPPVWAHWMNRTRAHRTELVPGFTVELDKWSSMGNGYTFEMESILFLAVCRSVVPRNEWSQVTVFGDDMMVPEGYATEVIRCLSVLGFEINTDKTFISGPFKESCGFDVWLHQPVRSIYIKEVPNSEDPTSFFHLANSIRRISLRLFADRPDRSRFRHAYSRVLTWLLPDLRRTIGPDPYLLHDLLGVHLVKSVHTNTGTRYYLTDEPMRIGWNAFYHDPELFTSFARIGANSWLHRSDATVPEIRLTTKQKSWNPERFPPGAQMIYALSGGDPNGPLNSRAKRAFYLT